MISIQEVTKQTGMSVRTLRYYDEIKLLLPTGKTTGGHRLYGEKELEKLREIQFLKTLGFTLKEIKQILADKNWNWRDGLQKQLNHVTKEKEDMIEIERTLIGLINSVQLDGDLDLNQTIKLIQLYQQKSQQSKLYREQFFTSELDQELLDKLPNINSDDPESLEWVSLLSQLKQAMPQGIHAPETQKIVQKMHEKTIDTFGDNDDFFDKVWAIRSSPEKSEQAGFYPIETEVLDFFEKAWEHFIAHKTNEQD